MTLTVASSEFSTKIGRPVAAADCATQASSTSREATSPRFGKDMEIDLDSRHRAPATVSGFKCKAGAADARPATPVRS